MPSNWPKGQVHQHFSSFFSPFCFLIQMSYTTIFFPIMWIYVSYVFNTLGLGFYNSFSLFAICCGTNLYPHRWLFYITKVYLFSAAQKSLQASISSSHSFACLRLPCEWLRWALSLNIYILEHLQMYMPFIHRFRNILFYIIGTS